MGEIVEVEGGVGRLQVAAGLDLDRAATTTGGGEGVAGGSQCAVDDDLGSPVVGIEVHGVAGGKAKGPIVGDRLAVGEQDGNVGCDAQGCPEATVKPPEKTYCRLDVLVPIRLSASV